jgi:anti-anti-sigma regulatory factor
MLGMCKAVGEIDAASALAFGVLIRGTIDGSDGPRVSVDCSGVTFMDPAGYTHSSTRLSTRPGVVIPW